MKQTSLYLRLRQDLSISIIYHYLSILTSYKDI
nr:MAG TPA: hypothetical protein [Caudoviricetes sp.]